MKPSLVKQEKVKALGGYLTKYMEKDFDQTPFDKKRFFTSRNVKLHKIRYCQNVSNLEEILSSFRKYAIEEKPFGYKSEHHGLVIGTVLYLKRTDVVYRMLQFLVA